MIRLLIFLALWWFQELDPTSQTTKPPIPETSSTVPEAGTQDSDDKAPDSDSQEKPKKMKVGSAPLKVYQGASPLTRRIATWASGTEFQILGDKGHWTQVRSGEEEGFALIPGEDSTSAESLKSSRFVTATTTALASRGLGKQWAKSKGPSRSDLLEILTKQRFSADELNAFQERLRRSK